MDVKIFRQIVNLVLYAIKIKKFDLLLEIGLRAIKGGFDYQEAMGRLDGSWYEKQIKVATDNYLKDKELQTNIPGFKKYLDSFPVRDK